MTAGQKNPEPRLCTRPGPGRESGPSVGSSSRRLGMRERRANIFTVKFPFEPVCETSYGPTVVRPHQLSDNKQDTIQSHGWSLEQKTFQGGGVGDIICAWGTIHCVWNIDRRMFSKWTIVAFFIFYCTLQITNRYRLSFRKPHHRKKNLCNQAKMNEKTTIQITCNTDSSVLFVAWLELVCPSLHKQLQEFLHANTSLSQRGNGDN